MAQFRSIAISLALAVLANSAAAQADPPPVRRELRAVWLTTVDNMDWPSRAGLTSQQQQDEMLAILDRCVELHMNAVIFQVRPAADAFYASKLEPWSEYLTGKMGQPPNPYYDPLTFTIAEAHKRGLELHVWINPYRARYSTTRKASPSHISRANPGLVRKYGPYVWMDPGDKAVRTRTKNVVLDLVKRYDIDAVHMDDYFYPYKEVKRGREIPFPDASTYKRYRKAGGTLDRDDWRRHNVDLLVEELNDAIHKAKPTVRFGISPFGIWRPGYPESVRGLDQFSEIYADARKWINEGWVDYLTPQLYWSVDRPQQRYDLLLEWWTQQNLKGRHIWPGNYTSKVGFTNSSAFSIDEILEQIRLTRAQPGATGNVHFSMEVFMKNPVGLNERLLREAYADQALVPATSWLPSAEQSAPVLIPRVDVASPDRFIETRVSGGTAKQPAKAPWLWVVQTKSDQGWVTRIRPGSEPVHSLPPRTTEVRVLAVDRLGKTSPESRLTLPP